MKNIAATLIVACACAGCADTPTVSAEKMTLSGETLPEISHMTDMKLSGDTLWFVYETPDGYGRRFLRSAIVDWETATLRVRPEIGHSADMPCPIAGDDGRMRVIDQLGGELFSIADSTALTRERRFLFGDDSTLPFPLSSYVKDVFELSPGKYLFRGREPKGGCQYAMISDGYGARVDCICRLCASPEYESWTVNDGEMAYLPENGRIAFAYTLHPVIDFFSPDGSKAATVTVAMPTFDSSTLEQPDFESLNLQHFKDITQADGHIFALYWGHKYNDTSHPDKLYILTPDGTITATLTLPFSTQKIAASTSRRLITFTRPAAFHLLTL